MAILPRYDQLSKVHYYSCHIESAGLSRSGAGVGNAELGGTGNTDGDVGSNFSVLSKGVAFSLNSSLALISLEDRLSTACEDDIDGPRPALSRCSSSSSYAGLYRLVVPVPSSPSSSSISRAGFGKVLYVDPRDVYLQRNMKTYWLYTVYKNSE